MSLIHRLVWFGVALSLTLLLTGGEVRAGLDQDPYILTGEPLKGRDLFVSKGCIKCHSVWSIGGKLGPDLTRVGMGRSFLQIAGSLWSHSPKMIELMEQRHLPLPTLTPAQMRDLIAYLYYLNYFNEPGDAVQGQRLFSDKGCIYCHSIGNMGGAVGPRLDTYQQYGSPLYVAQAMWNHGPRMTSAMAGRGIRAPMFQGKEMADLLAFIRGNAVAGIPDQKLTAPGDPLVGKRLFTRKGCSKCHAVRGAGGAVGPDLGRKEMYRSVTGIAGAMWNHGPAMWAKMGQMGIARPRFTKNEMADLIAYLYFVGYTDTQGNTAGGQRLFAQKGCAACHALGGTAGKVGPDLSTSAAIASPLRLIAAMWNHAPTMERLVQEKGLPWPKFEGDEMRDLVEYVRSFAPETASRTKPR
jgi:cytochrome c2